MPTWLVDPANNIELSLPYTTDVRTISGRIIKKYAALASNTPKIIQEEPLPINLQVLVKLIDTSAFENTKRKLMYMDKCGEDILLVLGSEQEAVLGGVEMSEVPRDVRRKTIMQVSVNFVGKGIVLGHMREAEDADQSSGVVEASDANASGGLCVQLNAQNEQVSFTFTQSVWSLPIGNYRMYIRAKDSAQVANDCRMVVTNVEDSHHIANTTKTLTASYAWYSLDVTTDSSENGDTIYVRVWKDTATANTISVDMLMLVMI